MISVDKNPADIQILRHRQCSLVVLRTLDDGETPSTRENPNEDELFIQYSTTIVGVVINS